MDSEALGAVSVESGFSMAELILGADPIVQAVPVIVVLASIWSWAVSVENHCPICKPRRKFAAFEDAFWSGRGDYEIRPGQTPDEAGARLFASISREWQEAKAISQSDSSLLMDRAERSLRASSDREIGRIGAGLGALATIGSSSPFIGLFGTVWGIMNAFINISAQEDTSLAVVGGPIAEALFATGLGLIAAIPAVIFYNKYSGDLNHYADRLDAFSQDILVRLSRRVSEGQP